MTNEVQQCDRECAYAAIEDSYLSDMGFGEQTLSGERDDSALVQAARISRERMEREAVQPLRDELAETAAIAERDGYEQAVQDIDCLTGGDGEYRGSTIPGRTVDCAIMKQRIAERFEAASEREKALQARVAELEEGLEPFAKMGRLIDGQFAPALFKDEDSFVSGGAWSDNGERRTLTFKDLRNAAALMAQALAGGRDDVLE